MGRESTIEDSLEREARKRGGWCPKFTSPGTAGMPDRIILLPGGRAAFAETKSPGKAPRPLQEKRHDRLEELGFKVFRQVDGSPAIQEVCRWMDEEEERIGREAAAWRDRG